MTAYAKRNKDNPIRSIGALLLFAVIKGASLRIVRRDKTPITKAERLARYKALPKTIARK